MKQVPYLIAVNLTARCNLNCAHCYMDARQKTSIPSNELTCEELSSVFEDIAREAPGTIIVLTGGEPLLHSQIEEIADVGVRLGLRMVLGTNGVLLSESRIRTLKKIGLSGVGVSLDSVCPDQHDSFRGVPGAFARSVRAIELCRAHGLHTQIHFTVTKDNYDQAAQAVELSHQLGVSIINFFYLVCVGRGESHLDLPPDLYESSLVEISRLQEQTSEVMIQSRCTPHFKRILYQNDPSSPFTRAQGYDGGGCIAGSHYCRIAPDGEVTPCPYLSLSAGNIRDKPFWQIWDRSPLFELLRNPRLQGRCSVCEFRLLCGGCRARAFCEKGELMAEDPSCSYLPGGGAAVAVQDDTSPTNRKVSWAPDASVRLERIPLFLRGRIKRKLEEKAVAEGRLVVTVHLMKRLKAEREKELGIKFE